MIYAIFNRKTGAFIFMLASLLLLVACGSTEPEAEPAPTAEPTAIPTQETTETTAESNDTEIADTTSADENASESPDLPREGSIRLEKTVFEPAEEIKITVTIKVSDDSDAWVGIIPSEIAHGSEAENDQYDLTYAYVINAIDEMVTLNAPLEAGNYDVRLFNTDNGDYGVELDSVSITVGKETVDTAAGGGDNDSSDAESTTEGNEEGTDDSATTGTMEGNDSCLEGTWRVANFDDYLVASVKSSMEGQDIEVSSSSTGDLLLDFDGETMSMRDENFVVTMDLMGITTPVVIDASGSAQYTADGTTIQGFVEAVNVQEQGTGIGISLGGLVGNPVNYTCTGDTMQWAGPFAIPIELARVN